MKLQPVYYICVSNSDTTHWRDISNLLQNACSQNSADLFFLGRVRGFPVQKWRGSDFDECIMCEKHNALCAIQIFGSSCAISQPM